MLTHHCDKAAELPSVGCGTDCGLHPFRGRCRPAALQRFPDPDAKEGESHRSVRRRARSAEHSGEVSGAGAFGESREVEALTKLLRALADPQDPLGARGRAAWSALRHQRSRAVRRSSSPAAGSASSSMRTRPVRCLGRRTVSVSALDALNHYYRWTRILPTAGALERILEASGYLALAATTPGGVDAGDVLARSRSRATGH